MNEENKNTQNNGPENNNEKLFAFVAIGLTVAGAVAFGLSFTVLGIYALIASLLLEIGAMTFVNVQKKKKDFKWLLYVKIAAYVLFFAAVLVFVGGTVFSAKSE